MRTFTLIWFGQLVSTIGSYMTGFALTIWAWQLTGSATALALVGFFGQLPAIPITLVAGLLVDRVNRKTLMMLADAIAALSTLVLGLLVLTQHLQIWHLYLVAAVTGGVGRIQSLAYQTSISLLVPKPQYTRANSMNSAVHYSSVILGPALAGALFPLIGLTGILGIDVVTFGVAIATLLAVQIPQPTPDQTDRPTTLTAQLIDGLRDVWQQPGLRAFLAITALFWFVHDLGEAVYDPMILARTGGKSEVLGLTASAAGVGGVMGAVLLSLWGGPRSRIQGMLGGFIGAGLSKALFGWGRSLQVWVPAQFCSSLNFPLLGSCETAIWMEQIGPEKQGRVFATNALVTQTVSAIAALIAGPLADHVFEPLMRSPTGVSPLLSPIVGTDPGSGMALLYLITSVSLIAIGMSGYALPVLQTIQTRS